MRYINTSRVIAAQLVTPAENPLVSDETRMADIWFGGEFVRKQMFKKMRKEEQEALAADFRQRGFLQVGNLYIDPAAILYGEMENTLLGGIVTIGFQEGGKPVELKVDGARFEELMGRI